MWWCLPLHIVICTELRTNSQFANHNLAYRLTVCVQPEVEVNPAPSLLMFPTVDRTWQAPNLLWSEQCFPRTRHWGLSTNFCLSSSKPFPSWLWVMSTASVSLVAISGQFNDRWLFKVPSNSVPYKAIPESVLDSLRRLEFLKQSSRAGVLKRGGAYAGTKGGAWSTGVVDTN